MGLNRQPTAQEACKFDTNKRIIYIYDTFPPPPCHKSQVIPGSNQPCGPCSQNKPKVLLISALISTSCFYLLYISTPHASPDLERKFNRCKLSVGIARVRFRVLFSLMTIVWWPCDKKKSFASASSGPKSFNSLFSGQVFLGHSVHHCME